MAGGITAFAYCPPSTITNKSNETDTITEFFINKKSVSQEKLISDFFAVSDDTVYDLCYTTEVERTICVHNYSISVEVKKHIRNSNGGCTVKAYDGLRCTKCEDVQYGELLYTTTYPSCPH